MRRMRRMARVEGVLGLAVTALAVSALLLGCGGAAPEEAADDDEQQASEAQETVERTVPTRLEQRDPSEYSTPAVPVEYIYVTLKAGRNVQLRLKIDQVQMAVNMFKAEQDRLPQSRDELLDMNYGPLPSLTEGRRYNIDQTTGEVTIVERVPRDTRR